MPIYEYECGHCGERLTRLQKTTDRLLTKCPACKTKRLRKLLSATAFRLKGSGWYVTDFKNQKTKSAPEAETPKDKNASKAETQTTKAADDTKKAADAPVSTAAKTNKEEPTSPAAE